MPEPDHLSFLQGATEEFLNAFETHETLTQLEGGNSLQLAGRCARDLYVALEKGFKHSLARIDPYLVMAKPEAAKIIALRRDMGRHPVPTIFCSHVQFETLSLSDTWATLRKVSLANVDERVVSDFDEALKPVVDIRHRAQHGELYDDPENILLAIEQVFARFLSVAQAFAPDWLEILFKRNGQLESRLKGIERKIDASWQVLIDYLRRNGPQPVPLSMFVTRPNVAEYLEVLLGGGSENRSNELLAKTEIPIAAASGLFSTVLTSQQAGDRYEARRAIASPSSSSVTPARGLARALFIPDPAPPKGKPRLVPLDPGALHIPATQAWLKMRLTDVTPPNLLLGATLRDLRVEFPDAEVVDGIVSAKMITKREGASASSEQVALSGAAYLGAEWALPAEGDWPERTTWTLELILTMSLVESVAPTAPQ